MKKIVFLAATFTLSLALIAQNDTKTKTVPTKIQSKPVKTVTTEAPKVEQAQQVQTTQSTQPSVDAVIKMNTEKHDFGKVKQNIPVTYAFEIKNISEKPVVVENSYSSCGCTTPEKITEPIMPGSTVKLKVQYNAAAVGPINKDVYIKLAGIDQPKVVKIVGEVVAAEPSKPAN